MKTYIQPQIRVQDIYSEEVMENAISNYNQGGGDQLSDSFEGNDDMNARPKSVWDE